MVIGISRRLLASLFVLVAATGFQTPPTGNSSGTAKAVNPVSFSIKGLRLHMTPDEARPIMEQLNTENASRMQVHNGMCIAEEIAALKEHRNDTATCVQSMKMDLSGRMFQVSVEFAEDLPKSPGGMRLWHIHFEQTDLKTEADLKTFLSAVVEKFGSPTFRTLTEIGYCAETGHGKTCRVQHYENFNGRATLVPLECAAVGLQGCRFQLSNVGLYARTVRGSYPGLKIEIDLYDAALDSQSTKEKAKIIRETRTTGKPVL